MHPHPKVPRHCWTHSLTKANDRLPTSSSRSLSCSFGSIPPTYTLAACDQQCKLLRYISQSSLDFIGLHLESVLI